MIPTVWQFSLLALGGWRLWRLVAQDDLPPIAALRIRVVGASWSDRTEEWVFGRPLLAHFLQCAYCSGFWIAAIAYGAWWAEPHWTLVALAPFALSAAVGLLAQRLG